MEKLIGVDIDPAQLSIRDGGAALCFLGAPLRIECDAAPDDRHWVRATIERLESRRLRLCHVKHAATFAIEKYAGVVHHGGAHRSAGRIVGILEDLVLEPTSRIVLLGRLHVADDERRFGQHTVAVSDVHEHAAAATSAAALVRVAAARESRSEHFLTEAQIRDVMEVVVSEWNGRIGALEGFWHGIDPIV
jgi:hypothetical protein